MTASDSWSRSAGRQSLGSGALFGYLVRCHGKISAHRAIFMEALDASSGMRLSLTRMCFLSARSPTNLRKAAAASYEGRRCNYLGISCLVEVLVHVYDLKLMAPLEMLLTQSLDVFHGSKRLGRHSGHIQLEYVCSGLHLLGCRLVACRCVVSGIVFHIRLLNDHALGRGSKSSPMSTRSVSERSPIIFRSGGGSLLTRVGRATI